MYDLDTLRRLNENAADHVREAPATYATVRAVYNGRGQYKTFDGMVNDPQYGVCRKVIYRYIGNDSGTTGQLTLNMLTRREPNVGFWEGDLIQYFKLDGPMIAEDRGDYEPKDTK